MPTSYVRALGDKVLSSPTQAFWKTVPSSRPRTRVAGEGQAARPTAPSGRTCRSPWPASTGPLAIDLDKIAHTSNKSFAEWAELLSGGGVIATAILDRRLHHSHVIVIRGESYRLKDKRRAGTFSARIINAQEKS